MPIDIRAWLDQAQASLQAAFGPRLLFLGLQGSYGRGEAQEGSDIDLVVILDEAAPEDWRRAALRSWIWNLSFGSLGTAEPLPGALASAPSSAVIQTRLWCAKTIGMCPVLFLSSLSSRKSSAPPSWQPESPPSLRTKRRG